MTMYLARATARVAAVLILTCGGALAQPASLFESGDKQPSIKLTAVILEMQSGTPYLSLRSSNCLFSDRVVSATGGREPQSLPPYTAVFNAELKKAGFNATADDDLFNEADRGRSDYQAGAVITDAKIRACMGDGSIFGAKGEASGGTGTMTVEWQVFSPAEKKVVARFRTSGAVTREDKGADSLAKIFGLIFAGNVRELAAKPEFRTAVTSKAPRADEVMVKDQQAKITLSGSLKAAKLPIADAVGSAVSILTGDGSGSGVLVSDDGYILTNAHVVGNEKQLRVCWSDGVEKVGQVIRSSKPRDIALIKTDPRERLPLPIQRGGVSPGQRVFAIGSPLGKEQEGTVSGGVISASNRIRDGMRFIQSDVAISHGSSGGPLLNETGSVIGITVSGYDGDAQGLNFFIPIGDAMDFLNLEQN